MKSLYIKIHNDGKQKWQSFTGTIDIDRIDVFEETEADAVAMVKKEVENLIESLKSIDYDKPVMINFDGTPVDNFGTKVR